MSGALRAVAPARPDPRAEAVARTVLYAALFDYPLTIAQLRESLIGLAQTEAELLATYRRSAWLRTSVWYEQGLFFPAGRRELIATRRARERSSLAFLERHRTVLNVICALPFVRMVAISGSLAHLNLDDRGDVDLFVVTRGRRVWAVTVAIVLLAKLLRRRRTVCVNYVVSDRRLAIAQQDLFTANQIIHLKPIAGADVFTGFVAANPFVTQYYPNFSAQGEPRFPFAARTANRRVKRLLETVLAGPSLIAEAACRAAYRRYLRLRSASWQSPQHVKMDADCLKLHTRSHREPVLARFDAAVAETIGCDD